MAEMFVFFIHPRDTSPSVNYHDVERIRRIYGVLPMGLWIPIGWFTKLLELLPGKTRDKVLALLPPLATGKIYSDDKCIGWIVTIPMTARQMISMANGSPKQKAELEAKLVRAVEISKRLGAKIVGLGAMTSPVTVGGKTLSGKINGVGITNGNALTAVINVRGLKAIASKTGIDLYNNKIAVVGATGSVGKASVFLLAEELEKCEMLLISRSPNKLQRLKEAIEKQYRCIKIAVSSKVEAVRDCDIILVVTSDPGTIIKREHLKEGAVVYDDTQPRNVACEIAKYPEVLVVDGSIVRIRGARGTMDIGLPSKQDMYACLAETFLLSQEGRFGDFSLGREVIDQAREIQLLTKKLTLAPFQSFGRELTEADFARIRYVRRKRG